MTRPSGSCLRFSRKPASVRRSPVAAQLDVGRLEVAVDDALVVGVLEAGGYLPRDLEHPLAEDLAPAAEALQAEDEEVARIGARTPSSVFNIGARIHEAGL